MKMELFVELYCEYVNTNVVHKTAMILKCMKFNKSRHINAGKSSGSVKYKTERFVCVYVLCSMRISQRARDPPLSWSHEDIHHVFVGHIKV